MGKYDNDGRSMMWKAAIHRRADAWALLASGAAHARGALYVGGYAIECRLKAIAMEVHGCWTLRQLAERLQIDENDVFTHGLEALLGHMPKTLRDNMRGTGGVWRAFAGEVNLWRPSWRYDARPVPTERGRSFLEAADVVFKWLDANRA